MHNVKPLVLALLLAACPMTSRSVAPACTLPAPLLAKLLTEYTNYNRLTLKEEGRVEHFSMVKAGTMIFIRHNIEDGRQSVSVYEGTEEIGLVICADDENWVDCALSAQPYHYYHYQKSPVVARVSGPPCDFDIRLPEWKPSPDTPEKRKVAADVLEQFTVGKTADLKSVYVRDFNLSDTGLDIYFLYKNGEVIVQGCGFDVKQHPRCVGHLYGQAPLEPIIKHIMQRPYRLYPPPIGKP